MTRPRYNIAGVRDYTGVALTEIISDIVSLHDETLTLLSRLQGFEREVNKKAKRLDNPNDIMNVIRYHISLFEDYARDLKRLFDELPDGVEERHIKIIEGISTSAAHHNGGMIYQFKEDHICRDLKDETLRRLLDDIYSSIRQHIVNVFYGCSFKNQLATYIGIKISSVSKGKAAEPLHGSKVMIEPLPVPQGAKWKDILIRFRGEEDIEIRVGKRSLGVHTFARCGFIDHRSGKPNKQWILLRCFAAKGGELDVSDIGSLTMGETKNLKKGVSVLRQQLRNLFKIQGEPISKYFRFSRSWKTQFVIGTAIIGDDKGLKSDRSIREEILELFKEQQEDYKEDIKKDYIKELRRRGRYGEDSNS